MNEEQRKDALNLFNIAKDSLSTIAIDRVQCLNEYIDKIYNQKSDQMFYGYSKFSVKKCMKLNPRLIYKVK